MTQNQRESWTLHCCCCELWCMMAQNIRAHFCFSDCNATLKGWWSKSQNNRNHDLNVEKVRRLPPKSIQSTFYRETRFRFSNIEMALFSLQSPNQKYIWIQDYIIYCAFWMLLPSCKINTNTQNQDEGDEKSWLVWLVKSCLFYAGNKASAWFYRTKWPPRTFADLTCSCSLANNSAFCLVWALKLKEEGYGACN